MKIHDVTLTLRPGMTTWGNEPGPTIEPLRRIAKGDMVIIPAGTPHWWSEIQETISYTVVRIDPSRVVTLK